METLHVSANAAVAAICHPYSCGNKTEGSRLCVLIDVRSCQAEQRTEEEAVIKMGLHLSEINGGIILGIDQEPCVCVFGIIANYRTFALSYLLVYFQSAGKESSTNGPTLDSGRTVWFPPL